MRKSSIASIFVLGVAAATPARAGFLADTGIDNLTFTVDPNIVSVGDTFSVPSGTITTYVADPGDPQIAASALPEYGYTLNATVDSVSGSLADLIGTYRIYYNLANQAGYVAGVDTSISSGVLSLEESVGGTAASPFGVYSGDLTETQGPTGPQANTFVDFGSYFPTFQISGEFDGSLTTPGTGTLQSTFNSTTPAPIPEPTGLGVLSLAAVGLMRRRRAQSRV